MMLVEKKDWKKQVCLKRCLLLFMSERKMAYNKEILLQACVHWEHNFKRSLLR